MSRPNGINDSPQPEMLLHVIVFAIIQGSRLLPNWLQMRPFILEHRNVSHYVGSNVFLVIV